MRLKRTAIAVAGLGLAAGLIAGPVPAANAGAAAKPKPGPSLKTGPATVGAACGASIGSFRANGMTSGVGVTANQPPTAVAFKESFKLLPASVSNTWFFSQITGRQWWYGEFISGSSLYGGMITWDGEEPEPEVEYGRIGGGWDKFIALEKSDYLGGPGPSHSFRYGLRNDGILFRWNGSRKESYPGFAAVKTMTLISETATYDTMLATLKGGSLYTIRIPVKSGAKPIVRQVRKSTWQGFETLVAEKCGNQGTLLTAIDKDTGNGYLYAIGRANGLQTVIQGRGKVPYSFKDNAYHLMTPELNNLSGD